jgi:hypothetical protein
LAVPDETVQILLGSVSWMNLARVLALAGGASFITQVGVRSAHALQKKIFESSGQDEVASGGKLPRDILSRLATWHVSCRGHSYAVIFGFYRVGRITFCERNVGMEIITSAESAIAKAIVTLALIGSQFEAALSDKSLAGAGIADVPGRSSDVSGWIAANADGTSEIQIRPGTDRMNIAAPIVFRFDPDGNLI